MTTLVGESVRARAANRRRERRHALTESNATVRVMGSGTPPIPCRIMDMSRSGMRIALDKPLPVSGQVCVEWGDHFFVGHGRHMQAKDNLYVLGLELVSCSYSGFFERWGLELRGLAAFGAAEMRRLGSKLLRQR